MQYVFGYTAANDICARDWVYKNAGQVVLSSAMDQTCPLGPSVVTTDEVGGIYCFNHSPAPLVTHVKSWGF